MEIGKPEPWMTADAYGRSLHGLTVNLLVADVARTARFQSAVLKAETVYADSDFAVFRLGAGEWMVHSDRSYRDHPLSGTVLNLEGRGAGIELRVHGCDPDRAVSAARDHGYYIMADAGDKPHGVREAFIIDDDGYLWVPDIPLADTNNS